MPPLPGSPAIDAGLTSATNSLTDQRGFSRMVGSSIDIGAVEIQATIVTTEVDEDNLVPGAGLSLREAIAEGWKVAQPYPLDGSWWMLRQDWKLSSLHQDPEFIAMMDELEADIAAQRQWYEYNKDKPLF